MGRPTLGHEVKAVWSTEVMKRFKDADKGPVKSQQASIIIIIILLRSLFVKDTLLVMIVTCGNPQGNSLYPARMRYI